MVFRPTPTTGSALAARAASAERLLADLPAELVEHVLTYLEARDLAAANATTRLFRGAPGGRSPIESVLRERVRMRGHECALPTVLPAASTWTVELLVCERVLELARAHTHVVAAAEGLAGRVSAFVDAAGGLHTCGEEAVRHAHGIGTGDVGPPTAGGHHSTSSAVQPARVAALSAVRVCAVAGGGGHVLALADNGAVYECGRHPWRQPGAGGTGARRSFQLVLFTPGEAMVGIAAGGGHSIALSAAGCAYSWGANLWGQLGHGDTEARQQPQRVETLDDVRVGAIAAGRQHTLLLSTAGVVYSCGNGWGGALGHGDQQHQHAPRRIEALAGVRAVYVSGGGRHSLVVDAAGGVYSTGSGVRCLGHGLDTFTNVPKPVKALAGVRAIRATAGDNVSAVVDANGSVHTFGINWSGQLGLGGKGVHALPARVVALAHERVMAVVVGPKHTLFVTASGGVYSCGERQSVALGGVGHGASTAWPVPDPMTPDRITGVANETTPKLVTHVPRLRAPGCTA